MTNMTVNPHSFDDNDRKLLSGAYESLLGNRETAVASIASLIRDKGYLSGVIVDAVIGGLMEHFHEVVRMPGDHDAEFNTFGKVGTNPGTPTTYIANRLSEIEVLVGDLSQAAKRSLHSNPVEGGDESRNRAVAKP